MRAVRHSRLAVILILAVLTAGSIDMAMRSPYWGPRLGDPRLHSWGPPVVCAAPVRKILSASESPDDVYKILYQHRLAEGLGKEDRFWEARYLLYQGLISRGSTSLLPPDAKDVVSGESLSLCPLHGRADVLDTEYLITALAGDYPDVEPIMVAAAIAEQASDVERVFGLDVLEKAVLSLSEENDLSVGIAQLRPQEAASLGLEDTDLFDPETAVRGMYVKIQAANERIDLLDDPDAPISLTDRMMLLSLAQNEIGNIDEFFSLQSDWTLMLGRDNHARVMRYFLVHLDWLIVNGWTLPEDVDLVQWRETVFSVAES